MGGVKKLHDFVLDSKGHCFFCLKGLPLLPLDPEDPHGLKQYPTYPLQSLWSHLKIELEEFFTGKGQLPQNFLEWVRICRLKVPLCEGCAYLSETFAELYGQLERIQLKMVSCVHLIHGNLVKAEKTGNRQHFSRLVDNQYNAWNGVLMRTQEIVEEMRNEAIQKSSQFLKSAQPHAKAHTLGITQINGDSFNRFGPTLATSTSRTAFKRPETKVPGKIDMSNFPDLEMELVENHNDNGDGVEIEEVEVEITPPPAEYTISDDEEEDEGPAGGGGGIDGGGGGGYQLHLEESSSSSPSTMMLKTAQSQFQFFNGNNNGMMTSNNGIHPTRLKSQLQPRHASAEITEEAVGAAVGEEEEMVDIEVGECFDNMEEEETGEVGAGPWRDMDDDEDTSSNMPPTTATPQNMIMTFNQQTDKAKCPNCNREYDDEETLQAHYKKVHLNTRHKCELCGMEFHYSNSYNRHYETVHMGVRFNCDKCTKTFTQKAHLLYHQRTSCGQEGRPNRGRVNRCRICGKGFSTRETLKQHLRKVHKQTRVTKLTTEEDNYGGVEANLDEDQPESPPPAAATMNGNPAPGPSRSQAKMIYVRSKVNNKKKSETAAPVLPSLTPAPAFNMIIGTRISTEASPSISSNFVKIAPRPAAAAAAVSIAIPATAIAAAVPVKIVPPRFKCQLCEAVFVEVRELVDHVMGSHVGKRIQCKFCQMTCPTMANLFQHRKVCSMRPSSSVVGVEEEVGGDNNSNTEQAPMPSATNLETEANHVELDSDDDALIVDESPETNELALPDLQMEELPPPGEEDKDEEIIKIAATSSSPPQTAAAPPPSESRPFSADPITNRYKCNVSEQTSHEISKQQKKRVDLLKNPDPKKAEQVERLGMCVGVRAGASHSVLSQMQEIVQENPSSSSTKSKPKYGDSFFDDYEIVESASSVSDRGSSASFMSNLDSYSKSSLDFDFDRPSKPKVEEDEFMAAMNSTSRPKTKEPSSSSASSFGTEAQKKFGNAKAISSDQMFGDTRDNDVEEY